MKGYIPLPTDSRLEQLANKAHHFVLREGEVVENGGQFRVGEKLDDQGNASTTYWGEALTSGNGYEAGDKVVLKGIVDKRDSIEISQIELTENFEVEDLVLFENNPSEDYFWAVALKDSPGKKDSSGKVIYREGQIYKKGRKVIMIKGDNGKGDDKDKNDYKDNNKYEPRIFFEIAESLEINLRETKNAMTALYNERRPHLSIGSDTAKHHITSLLASNADTSKRNGSYQKIFLVYPVVNYKSSREVGSDHLNDPVSVVRMGESVADALNYLHNRGWAHTDLKQDQIRLTESLESFLGDLGSAIHKKDEDQVRQWSPDYSPATMWITWLAMRQRQKDLEKEAKKHPQYREILNIMVDKVNKLGEVEFVDIPSGFSRDRYALGVILYQEFTGDTSFSSLKEGVEKRLSGLVSKSLMEKLTMYEIAIGIYTSKLNPIDEERLREKAVENTGKNSGQKDLNDGLVNLILDLTHPNRHEQMDIAGVYSTLKDLRRRFDSSYGGNGGSSDSGRFKVARQLVYGDDSGGVPRRKTGSHRVDPETLKRLVHDESLGRKPHLEPVTPKPEKGDPGDMLSFSEEEPSPAPIVAKPEPEVEEEKLKEQPSHYVYKDEKTGQLLDWVEEVVEDGKNPVAPGGDLIPVYASDETQDIDLSELKALKEEGSDDTQTFE